MIAKNAAKIIKKASEYINYNTKIKAIPEDNWVYGAGELNTEDLSIHFSSSRILSLAETHPTQEIEGHKLFATLTTLGHELSHANDELYTTKLTFEKKLFHFIDSNLREYYLYKNTTINSYYLNNLCETEAEFFGIKFARNFLYHCGIPQKEIEYFELEYINIETSTLSYYIQYKNYTSSHSINHEFSKKIKKDLSHNFPNPAPIEQTCRQIIEDYKNCKPGIEQLAMICACTYKVRNYLQKQFEKDYGTEFWQKIRKICPSYMPQNNQQINYDNLYNIPSETNKPIEKGNEECEI